MKDRPKAAQSKEHSPTMTSEQVGEENLARILQVVSPKDPTSEQKKREASKPIYLVRYE